MCRCSTPPLGKCVFSLVHSKTHPDTWLHACVLTLNTKPRTPPIFSSERPLADKSLLIQALGGASFPASHLNFPLFLSRTWCIDASEVPRLALCQMQPIATREPSSPQTHQPTLLQSQRFPPPYSSLHSVRAIAPVVHCGRDGDNDSRHSISCQVEVLGPGVLTLKHLHQHDVELHPFQEHPGKGCQEEKMEQGSKDGTGNLAWERKDGEGLYKHQGAGNVSLSLHFHWQNKEQISQKHSRPEVQTSDITPIYEAKCGR